jgi:hypothetical protein
MINRFSFLNISFCYCFIASVIFGLIYLLVKPAQRGFYCDDTSIQYPLKPDTVPMWLLAIYGGIVPIIIVSVGKRRLLPF